MPKIIEVILTIAIIMLIVAVANGHIDFDLIVCDIKSICLKLKQK